MDSQLTLVDANELPDRQAYIELVFDRDSLTNAKLLVKGGSRTVYSIKTAGRSMSRTEIYKPQSTDRAEQTGGVPGELVLAAVIDRNEVLPDTISFTGLQKMKTRKWLQDNAFTVTHPDIGEVRYVWKPTSVRELVLYAEENPFVPVAWYRTAKRTSPVAAAGDVIEPPSLSIQPEGERIQDLVLASLLIVEQKYRMAAKSVRVATGFRNAPATPVPAIN